jgi:hypothetical protein
MTSTFDDADQATMQRQRVLRLQAAQPIAQARYLGTIGRSPSSLSPIGAGLAIDFLVLRRSNNALRRTGESGHGWPSFVEQETIRHGSHRQP